jgi:hypothetical protein
MAAFLFSSKEMEATATGGAASPEGRDARRS